jgi:hypothetical protein
MKLHLTLASLTLLFPFAAVAQVVPDVIPVETEWGKNRTPPELAPPDKGNLRSRALRYDASLESIHNLRSRALRHDASLESIHARVS